MGHFVCYSVLYECVFGAVYGFLVGYIARHGIKYAERHELIDRESFLVFYFVVALFCAGSGSLLGLDDLLVGFAAGVGFSNDGWFGEKTEESHVSNVIDLLLNLTYFVYLGTIIPWEQYNSGVEGLYVWRLVVIAILVIFFRRLPIMLALKPFIPDVRTWREALFAGHFGPIGVGAIFVAILARAELETGEPVPLAHLPSSDAPEFDLIYLVWPIVTFIVISSIIVHGSSIAVFTLGKRINTLTLTMSYTAAPEDGPSWMNRLPRISSTSRSQAKASEASFDEKEPQFPEGTLAPPGGFLRRRKDDDGSRQGSRASSLVSRRRKPRKDEGAGGPISQSAIFPNRDSTAPTPSGNDTPPFVKDVDESSPSGSSGDRDEDAADNSREEADTRADRRPEHVEVYEEGHDMVFENDDGDVLDIQRSPSGAEADAQAQAGELPAPAIAKTQSQPWTFNGLRRKVTDMYSTEREKRKGKEAASRRHEPARAYQFGNTIIVEDEDGEVVKTYEIPSQRPEGQASGLGTGLKYIGLGGRAAKNASTSPTATAEQGEGSGSTAPADRPKPRAWTSFIGGGGKGAAQPKGNQDGAMDDDKKIRFTIGGEGQRMTKEDFIREVQKLDSSTKKQVVEQSNAPQRVKAVAKQQPSRVPPIVEHQPTPDDESPASEKPSSPSKSTPAAQPSSQTGETAAEKRRRLAVLADQDDDDDEEETPAERRRRQAALGVSSRDAADEVDDDVSQSMRIRFAEPERGRR